MPIRRKGRQECTKIDLRFIEREMNTELKEELRINGGSRVPVVQCFSEDDK
jgi:hypothetical protein